MTAHEAAEMLGREIAWVKFEIAPGQLNLVKMSLPGFGALDVREVAESTGEHRRALVLSRLSALVAEMTRLSALVTNQAGD